MRSGPRNWSENPRKVAEKNFQSLLPDSEASYTEQLRVTDSGVYSGYSAN